MPHTSVRWMRERMAGDRAGLVVGFDIPLSPPSDNLLKMSRDAMKVTTSGAAYDQFAWFYNRYWGPEFCQDVFPVFERILLPLVPPPARILDLCCGTGQIAARLAELGYEVTGLDGSSGMLDFARLNSPRTDFILADARSFRLPEGTAPFDLVVSSFDSLNHILTVEELDQVFQNVYRSLVEGGIFLFDLNIEEENDLVGSTIEIVEADHVCLVRTSYRPESRFKTYELTLFQSLDGRPDGSYKRTELSLFQRYHERDEILQLLESNRFEQISTFDPRSSPGLIGNDSRIFYLACSRGA
jgi:SAM-dependent methyltransferase